MFVTDNNNTRKYYTCRQKSEQTKIIKIGTIKILWKVKKNTIDHTNINDVAS